MRLPNRKRQTEFAMANLNELLENYRPFDRHETAMVARLKAFLAEKGEHFGRELAGIAPHWGHVTGSAWIVDESGENVVLVFHRKLEKWVQPGGHCEGQSEVLEVAVREAREETGLDVWAHDTTIFDIDAHEIPEYWNTPAHVHYDVRFLLRAHLGQTPVVSDESGDVKWVSLEEAQKFSGEASIARMIAKTKARFGALEVENDSF